MFRQRTDGGILKGRGGHIPAAQKLMRVTAATDYDWRVLNRVRSNGKRGTIRLVRPMPE